LRPHELHNNMKLTAHDDVLGWRGSAAA